jgi:hypothetical protein
MRGMSRSRATSTACSPARPYEAQEREAAGVDAAADRHQPDAVGHRQVDEPVNAGGRLVAADPERLADPAHGRFRRRPVEMAPAPKEALGVEVAEDEVCVGDGRHRATRPVAGGTGDRAGALGARPQGARLHAGDRAAACADADDVEGTQRDALARKAPLGGKRRLVCGDERNVRRGAAHVEGHEVGRAQKLGGATRPGDAARRARQDRSGREPRRLLDRRHAAVGKDDEERAGVARLGQALGEARQVPGDGWSDIGVQGGGRDALELLRSGAKPRSTARRSRPAAPPRSRAAFPPRGPDCGRREGRRQRRPRRRPS